MVVGADLAFLTIEAVESALLTTTAALTLAAAAFGGAVLALSLLPPHADIKIVVATHAAKLQRRKGDRKKAGVIIFSPDSSP
jgi:hypothetical protein